MGLFKRIVQGSRSIFLVNRPLKQVLLLVTIPVAVLSIVLIGSVSSYISSKMMLNETIEHTKDLQSQVRLSLHYFIEQLYHVMDIPQYDAPFIILCREMIQQDPENVENDSVIFRYLHQIYSSNPYIENTLFVMPNGKIFSLGMNILDNSKSVHEIKMESWYRRAVESQGGIIWHESGPYSSFKVNLIMCSRQIWDTLNRETLGILTIAIHPDMLHDQYKDVNLIRNNTLLIATNDGYVISSSDPLLANKNIEDMPALDSVLWQSKNMAITDWREEKKIIVWDKVDLTNWKIVSILSHYEVMKSTRNIAQFTILVALLSISLFIFFSWKFSSTVTAPLDSLIDKMLEVRTGNFEVVVTPQSYQEINMLSDTFNRMTVDMKRLLQEVYESQSSKHETEIKLIQSELKTLQAQINPHFIYNTLESISTIAKFKSEWEISNVIIALSKLLRISLSKGKEVIPLIQELEMVTQYVTLQTINYPDRFSFSTDIEKKLYDYTIVKFTFQPLIENAIFHGFSNIEHKGNILLSGQINGENLLFELTDNGSGMDPEQVEQLNRELKASHVDSSTTTGDSFGIKNVNMRLKLHFGEKYGLQFGTNGTGGSTAKIFIPAKKIRKESEESV